MATITIIMTIDALYGTLECLPGHVVANMPQGAGECWVTVEGPTWTGTCYFEPTHAQAVCVVCGLAAARAAHVTEQGYVEWVRDGGCRTADYRIIDVGSAERTVS